MRRVDNNYFDRGDGSTLLMITQNGKTKLEVLLDTEDVDKVKGFHWNKHSGGYAISYWSAAENDLLMHRLIMGTIKGMEVDHINHNKADNRKANLRDATKANNARNRRLAANIRIDNRNSKPRFRVYFDVDGRQRYFGHYATLQEAIERRDKIKASGVVWESNRQTTENLKLLAR